MERIRSSKSENKQYHSSGFEQNENSAMHNPQSLLLPKKEHYPAVREKNMLCEITRITGQSKLLYIKQAKQRKLNSAQLFQKYPFATLDSLTFDFGRLRKPDTTLLGTVVEDERGVHLIETAKSQQGKYKSKQQLQGLNGLGVSIFQDGRIFQGVYHNNHFCGQGCEISPNGNMYIGMFREGAKHGEGTYYWYSNDEAYTGEWLGGLPHGYGVYANKDIYEGTFSNGLKYGFGEESFSNGDKYIGQYVNSVAEGYGEYYWKDGSIYKGDFKQGVRHGYGIWQDKHQMYKGGYRLDQKEGFGIYTWTDKQVYRGEFREDYRDGYGELRLLASIEKLVYKGCWIKGQKHEQGKVDWDKVQQLNAFLNQSDKIDEKIHQNSERPIKKRVGHKNCIPHDH